MPTIGSISPILRKSGSTDLSVPPAGWIGSKAGVKGDLVIVDSNGRVDQAVAVSTALTSATGRIARLAQNVPSSVLQGSSDAQVAIEKFDEDTLVSLQASDGSDTATPTVTTGSSTMIGKQYPLRRTAGGTYVVNTATNTNPVVEVVGLDPRYNVGEAGGPLLCRVLAASRLA